ncbi:hypothetical protein IAR55_003160 [Kwoniella newhampshirensis]|uniref:Fork-head domain-containing protein n=1 Tax=Kwoniella newhampshirensis TaxID=1651941 RepID=A0AAW0YZU7_9TREE
MAKPSTAPTHPDFVTRPTLDCPIVRSFGISSTLDADVESYGLVLTRSDLTRYRNNPFTPPINIGYIGEGVPRGGSKMVTISEGCWRKWEEEGGLSMSLAYAYDEDGKAYKPDLTYVQSIRIVIAASPRRMLTLGEPSKIYDAMEERWPWYKTCGPIWKNSVRHTLSTSKCFVRVNKTKNDAERIEKGTYWTVKDSLSDQTDRRPRHADRERVENVHDRLSPVIARGPSALHRISSQVHNAQIPHMSFVPAEVVQASRAMANSRPIYDRPFDSSAQAQSAIPKTTSSVLLPRPVCCTHRRVSLPSLADVWDGAIHAEA